MKAASETDSRAEELNSVWRDGILLRCTGVELRWPCSVGLYARISPATGLRDHFSLPGLAIVLSEEWTSRLQSVPVPRPPRKLAKPSVQRLCAHVYLHSEPFRVVTSLFPLSPQARCAWQTISSFSSSPKGKWSFKLTGNQQSVGWLTPSSISMRGDMVLTSLRIFWIIRMNLLLCLLLCFKYLQLFPYQMKSGRQWGLWGLRSRSSGCCWRWSQDQNKVQDHRWMNDIKTRKTRIGEMETSLSPETQEPGYFHSSYTAARHQGAQYSTALGTTQH